MPLHDILPPIEIDDHLFLYIFIGVLLLVGLSVFMVKYFYKRERKDARYYLGILEKCDFQDAKKTALQFSYYGRYIFTDEVTKAKFLALQQKLKKYKYIQNSTSLPQALEDEIKELLAEKREHHG